MPLGAFMWLELPMATRSCGTVLTAARVGLREMIFFTPRRRTTYSTPSPWIVAGRCLSAEPVGDIGSFAGAQTMAFAGRQWTISSGPITVQTTREQTERSIRSAAMSMVGCTASVDCIFPGQPITIGGSEG